MNPARGTAFPATYEAWRIEIRYRCVADRHPGHHYNTHMDRTWCRCGRIQRSGDHGQPLSMYEQAEVSACRPDQVGGQARATLNRVWGREVMPDRIIHGPGAAR